MDLLDHANTRFAGPSLNNYDCRYTNLFVLRFGESSPGDQRLKSVPHHCPSCHTLPIAVSNPVLVCETGIDNSCNDSSRP
ncbi:hypothetical protein HTIA_1436 [Halorhabdus tiamatea SARL4B]|uniref:Uncharacterized protein n=1 Tax=Halorhabdus tiamatea SARL4B TaxID=1033806 RepID=S6D0N4_9EURY|nr:hypothetical protein HTIA_1436 [Halorhabdus tiamatea SARL4B]